MRKTLIAVLGLLMSMNTLAQLHFETTPVEWQIKYDDKSPTGYRTFEAKGLMIDSLSVTTDSVFVPSANVRFIYEDRGDHLDIEVVSNNEEHVVSLGFGDTMVIQRLWPTRGSVIQLEAIIAIYTLRLSGESYAQFMNEISETGAYRLIIETGDEKKYIAGFVME